MLLIVILLILILAIQTVRVIQYRREMTRLTRQLNIIREGSRIELSSSIRSKEFASLYRQLETLLHSFHTDRLQYEKSQRQLKKTISNIAHDIRTPLTSAAGYLQMMEECKDEEKKSRYLSITRDRLEELKDMLEELFLYTKLTNDDFILELNPTPVFPVLCDCMISLYHAFEEHGFEPDVQFSDESLRVYASPESLGRIFRNLTSNALLHGAGGLQVTQKGTVLIFSNPVTDPKAIDPEQLFERFYKADHTRKRGSSGLGLAIVNELMKRMGGAAEARLHNSRLEILLDFKKSC